MKPEEVLNYRLITDENFTEKLETKLLSEKVFALDLETTGLTTSDKVLMIQIGTTDYQCLFDMRKFTNFSFLKTLLENPNTKKIGHNLKFDAKFLLGLNIRLVNIWDTFIFEKLLYAGLDKTDIPERNLNFKLNFGMCDKYYDHNINVGSGLSFVEMDPTAVFTEKQLLYSALDIYLAFDIAKKQIYGYKNSFGRTVESMYLKLKTRIPKFATLVELEMKVVLVLALMEYTGIYLDMEEWNIAQLQVQQQTMLLEKQIFEYLVDHKIVTKKLDPHIFKTTPDIIYTLKNQEKPVNLGSPDQIKIICGQLNINVPNTTESTLKKFEEHPFIKLLLELRGLAKLGSTYGDSWIKYINKQDNRIHASFDQTGTATGRVATRNPNLANIPRPTDELDLRKCFKPQDKNYLMITADFSGQELRILAELSQDPKFLQIFNEGHDPHAFITNLLFKLNIKKDIIEKTDVDPNQRFITKTLVFSYIYGAGLSKMSQQCGLEVRELVHFKKTFEQTFPRVISLLKGYHQAVKDFGYVTTIGGRLRSFIIPFQQFYHLIDTKAENKRSRIESEVERRAANHAIQGTGADVLKLALVTIQDYIDKYKIDARLVNIVYDEFVIEVHESQAESFKITVEKLMLEAFSHFIKLPVEVSIELKEYWSK